MTHIVSVFEENRSTLAKVQRSDAVPHRPLLNVVLKSAAIVKERRTRRGRFVDICEQSEIAEKVGDTAIVGVYNLLRGAGVLKEVGRGGG